MAGFAKQFVKSRQANEKTAGESFTGLVISDNSTAIINKVLN